MQVTDTGINKSCLLRPSSQLQSEIKVSSPRCFYQDIRSQRSLNASVYLQRQASISLPFREKPEVTMSHSLKKGQIKEVQVLT